MKLRRLRLLLTLAILAVTMTASGCFSDMPQTRRTFEFLRADAAASEMRSCGSGAR